MQNRVKWITIGVIVVLLLVLAGMYNGLVRKEVAVDTAWSQVENVLQRRSDLIPNLVASVKGYVKHEKGVLENLAQARTMYAGARTAEEKMKASGMVEGALARLLVIVENYPNLKANENFARLMDELSGTENRIAVERKRYNEAVQTLNVAVRTVPTLVAARLFGFKERSLFEAEPGARAVPKVDFEK